MRMTTAVLVGTMVLVGCTNPRPTIDCQLDTDCDLVVAAASEVLPAGDAKWVITAGRGAPGVFHAEVHACYPDGRNLLVDVFDGIRRHVMVLDERISDDPGGATQR